MRVSLSPAAREAMARHLCAAYPHEGCGALVGHVDNSGDAHVERAIGLANRRAPSTDDRFEIDPLEYARIEAELTRARSGRVIGFFHSHPDGRAEPSIIDLEMAQGLFEVAQEYYVYAIQVIASGQPGELTLWRLNASQSGFESVPVEA
jgi:proteasome lid subunit RPN8/RPN11